MSDGHTSRGESAEMPTLYGTWPGGLLYMLTVDLQGRIPAAQFPLDIWTLEGEQHTFTGRPWRSPAY